MLYMRYWSCFDYASSIWTLPSLPHILVTLHFLTSPSLPLHFLFTCSTHFSSTLLINPTSRPRSIPQPPPIPLLHVNPSLLPPLHPHDTSMRFAFLRDNYALDRLDPDTIKAMSRLREDMRQDEINSDKTNIAWNCERILLLEEPAEADTYILEYDAVNISEFVVLNVIALFMLRCDRP
jgi:hypothetical protein